MTKFSEWILNPGTAGPSIVEGMRRLGIPRSQSTEAQARAGADTTTDMSPLRVAQAIDDRVGTATQTALSGKLPLTGGTLTGGLQLNTFVRVKAATVNGQARLDLLRNDNTLAARCWHYGTFNAMALDLMSTDGNSVLTRIELNGGTPGTVSINGSVIVTSANIQSYLGMLLPDYVSGMAVSYVNATTCSVAAGQARIGATAVSLASAMTKRLDGSWTAGSGNGGLDTGTVQPNATYHLRAIRNASTGVADLLWSASATAPTMPSGWNSIQRLQTVKTDGSGNIRPFVTDGRETRLLTPVNEYSGVGARALALITCAGLPTGIRVQALLQSGVYAAGSTDGGVRHTLGDGHQSSVQQAIEVYHSNGAKGITVPVACRTNTSAQIFFGVQELSSPASINTLTTLGWIDHSIPRI